jgi:hypothetical protein
MLFEGNKGSQSSDDFVALPACRLGVDEALARMRLLRVPVFAHEGVGVLLLVEISKCVIDLAVLALVRTNFDLLAKRSRCIWTMLTVEKKIAHGSVTLWHLPVVDGDLRSLHLLPLR